MSAPGGPEPDVLEFGGPEPDRPRPRWRWLAWLPLGLVAVLAGVFVVNAQHDRNATAGPSPTPAAATHPPATGPSSGTARPSPAGTDPSTVDGRPWLQTAGGWELVGMGSGGVVRVDPAGGHAVITPIPAIRSTGPVSLIAGRNWIMVRPLDRVPGYLIPDGHPARELTGALGLDGPVLPGPDGTSVWIEMQDRPELTLIDTDGKSLGQRMPVPGEAIGSLRPDGTGYAVFNGIGGAWSARPEGVRRISTGVLLAVGPTRWLVAECDDGHACQTVAIDRSNGSRRPVPGIQPQISGPLGVISPDGTRAALPLLAGEQGSTGMRVIDLGSGANQAVNLPPPAVNDGALAWSPDSAWLVAAGADGKVYAQSASTGQVSVLAGLPPVSQLTVRSAPQG